MGQPAPPPPRDPSPEAYPYPYPYPQPYPYPYAPYPYAPQQPRNAADVTASVLMMVMTVLLGGLAAVIGVFMLAFIDHCPPATCSIDGAVTAVMGALAVAALVGVTGVVLTMVAIGRRKKSWPLAAGTLGLCVVVLFGGFVGYFVAVGG
ncbi:MAG: hypothetical protein WAP49_18090 [Mycobacterium sp.]